MSISRFDTLSRVLARSTSRRDALRALGVFLGIATLNWAETDSASAQLACPPPLTPCGGVCVNLANHPRNCGACGTVCPSAQFCSAGQCQCAPGYSLCGSTCRNFQTDPRNCGTCNNVCPQGQNCAAGLCQLPVGVTNTCNGAPANTQFDPTNCGVCGVRCTAGQQLSGQCCGGACCSAGASCLSGGCVGGSACIDGQFVCAGSTHFLKCDHGGWITFSCAPGTVCRQIGQGAVECDFPI